MKTPTNLNLMRMGALLLGTPSVFGRGDLLLTGTDSAYSTDRGAYLQGLYTAGAGGAIGVSNAGTALTVSGQLTGAGSFIKTGAGKLILNNATNNYTGGTYVEAGVLAFATGTAVPPGGLTINGGRFDADADAQLGDAFPTVNAAGTLRYTANASTGRTFNLTGGTLEAPAGVTIALNGATVNGGFLRGAGTFALAAGTTLNGVTTLTSTTVNQTGTASVANFSNGGAYTVGAGQILAWNGGTNTSSGRLTVNGTVNVNDFVSNGLLTVAPGGVLNHTGSDMVLGGGSTTFVGSVANPGGKIDLGGQQLIVRGGLLVTNAGSFGSGNGVRNGTTVADYGALVKGTGPVSSRHHAERRTVSARQQSRHIAGRPVLRQRRRQPDLRDHRCRPVGVVSQRTGRGGQQSRLGIDADIHFAGVHGHAEQQIQHRHADATSPAGRTEFARPNVELRSEPGLLVADLRFATRRGVQRHVQSECDQFHHDAIRQSDDRRRISR